MSGEQQGSKQRHTNGDIWDRVNQQSDQISELTRVQAATEANLAALANTVETGFTSIQQSLDRINQRDDRPTNWIGIGSLIFATCAGILTFVTLLTGPIIGDVDRNYASIGAIIREMSDRGVYIGESDARLDQHQRWLQSHEDHMTERFDNFEQRISRLEGRNMEREK